MNVITNKGLIISDVIKKVIGEAKIKIVEMIARQAKAIAVIVKIFVASLKFFAR